MNIAHIIKLPEGWEYKGSISAWTWNDTYLCDEEIGPRPLDCDFQQIFGCKCGCNAQWYHVVLEPLAFIVYFVLFIMLIVPVMILTGLKKCCDLRPCSCCCSGLTKNSIFGEFRRKQI